MTSRKPSLFDALRPSRLKTTAPALVARLGERIARQAEASHPPVGRAAPDGASLVVASYNIHKCVGTDRRFDPGRIAAVIAELDADVVAIQEADKRFGQRYGLLDLDALKREAGLRLVPTSMMADGHGWHGNALFLRHGAVRTIHRLALPGAEPRGALLVDLDMPAGPLRIVAAHLGLLRRNRRWQIRSILSAIEAGPKIPTLLVGDLNEWRPGRKSSLHGLKPYFGALPGGLSSFPSYFPVVALDRVIGSPGLVTGMEVHDSPLAAVASDHLPLKARIDIAAALRAQRHPHGEPVFDVTIEQHR